MSNNESYILLRWVMFLPCALIVACLPFLFIGLINNSVTFSDTPKLDGIFDAVFMFFISALSFVAVGTLIVPKYKSIIVLILLSIVIFFSVEIFINFENRNVLKSICFIAGGLLGYAIIRENGKT